MAELSFSERLHNTGRNDMCPCGSKKKYKKCHLFADEEAQREKIRKQQEEREKVSKDNCENTEEGNAKKEHKANHTDFKNIPKPKITKGERLSNMQRRKVI